MPRKIIDNTRYLTPEQIRTLAKVTKDIFYFSNFIFVVNPVLGRVIFNLYPYQKSVLYQFLKERFNIILKFRQAGITELISMYCLWLAMYHANKKINIISIKDTVAKKVLKKIKFMYKNLPWYLQVPIVNGRTGEYGSASTMEVIGGLPQSSVRVAESSSAFVKRVSAVEAISDKIGVTEKPSDTSFSTSFKDSCIVQKEPQIA